jgi:hypothetical protein
MRRRDERLLERDSMVVLAIEKQEMQIVFPVRDDATEAPLPSTGHHVQVPARMIIPFRLSFFTDGLQKLKSFGT